MRPSILRETLIGLARVQQPAYVSGPPGGGKSSIARQAANMLYAEEYGFKCDAIGRAHDKDGRFLSDAECPWFIDVRAGLLDPVDLRGLPMICRETGLTKWAPPIFLPHDLPGKPPTRGLLNLDELANAPQLVQSAFLQLLTERRVGEYVLPPGWSVIAAGNRVEDRAGANRLISSMSARFLHIDYDVHPDDWQDWAEQAGIRSDVRSFLRARPTLLHQFNPAANERSWPNPRSWAFVSRVLPIATDETMHDLVSGCVGPGASAQACAHFRMKRSLPDAEEIIKAPTTFKVPVEPDVLHAVCCELADKVRVTVADKKRSDAVAQYSLRLPKEFSILLFRDLVKLDRAILATPTGREFLKMNRDFLIS